MQQEDKGSHFGLHIKLTTRSQASAQKGLTEIRSLSKGTGSRRARNRTDIIPGDPGGLSLRQTVVGFKDEFDVRYSQLDLQVVGFRPHGTPSIL